MKNQITSMYNQLLDLEEEYYRAPETITRRLSNVLTTAAQRARAIEAEQERILNQYSLLSIEYERLRVRLNQLYGQLCSSYYDVLSYYGYGSTCY